MIFVKPTTLEISSESPRLDLVAVQPNRASTAGLLIHSKRCCRMIGDMRDEWRMKIYERASQMLKYLGALEHLRCVRWIGVARIL